MPREVVADTGGEVHMTNGSSMSRQWNVGAMGYTSTSSGADAVRELLRRHAVVPLSAAELRLALRQLTRQARDGDVTVEQLLVVVKRAWAELPEVRGARADRADLNRRLERLVTVLIETYFQP